MSTAINFKRMHELVEEGYITVQKHPTANLYIWNYTHRAQFDRKWTPETMVARGLITDSDYKVIARPFTKFFNYEEYIGQDSKLQPLPIESFTLTDKMDGSLGILYWIGNEPFIATRGSFTSPQAIKATEILQKFRIHELDWKKEWTYLFEIIYPENRIVVDYGKREDLILLAVIETETGRELDIYKENADRGFAFVSPIDGVTNLEEVKLKVKDNAEGYVIRFESGFRVKVKFEEYVRLHRLITNINSRRIWETLKNGRTLDEILDRVPDEFYTWVRRIETELRSEFKKIDDYVKEKIVEVKKLETRREQALYIQEHLKYQSAVFALLNGKDPANFIWKSIRPNAEKPFREDES